MGWVVALVVAGAILWLMVASSSSTPSSSNQVLRRDIRYIGLDRMEPGFREDTIRDALHAWAETNSIDAWAVWKRLSELGEPVTRVEPQMTEASARALSTLQPRRLSLGQMLGRHITAHLESVGARGTPPLNPHFQAHLNADGEGQGADAESRQRALVHTARTLGLPLDALQDLLSAEGVDVGTGSGVERPEEWNELLNELDLTGREREVMESLEGRVIVANIVIKIDEAREGGLDGAELARVLGKAVRVGKSPEEQKKMSLWLGIAMKTRGLGPEWERHVQEGESADGEGTGASVLPPETEPERMVAIKAAASSIEEMKAADSAMSDDDLVHATVVALSPRLGESLSPIEVGAVLHVAFVTSGLEDAWNRFKRSEGGDPQDGG
jgi:hypothetical protein